jgi:hypothetical protein
MLPFHLPANITPVPTRICFLKLLNASESQEVTSTLFINSKVFLPPPPVYFTFRLPQRVVAYFRYATALTSIIILNVTQ